MKKDEFYKRVKDYEISHSGMPKNPRKDHKYLYIDKNGRYVYEEPNPVRTLQRAYLDSRADELEKRHQANVEKYILEPERKSKANNELAKSVVDSYARSQESNKNRQAADDARNAYAKSQEKTNSSTGSRPYSSPNDIKVVSGSDKEKFASSVKANDRIRKNQEIWAEFEKGKEQEKNDKINRFNQAKEKMTKMMDDINSGKVDTSKYSSILELSKNYIPDIESYNLDGNNDADWYKNDKEFSGAWDEFEEAAKLAEKAFNNKKKRNNRPYSSPNT